MKFKISVGTPCIVVLPHDHDEVEFITTKDNIFEESEVVFDPSFKVGVSIGPGIYGFEKQGFTLIVEQQYVEMLD